MQQNTPNNVTVINEYFWFNMILFRIFEKKKKTDKPYIGYCLEIDDKNDEIQPKSSWQTVCAIKFEYSTVRVRNAL